MCDCVCVYDCVCMTMCVCVCVCVSTVHIVGCTHCQMVRIDMTCNFYWLLYNDLDLLALGSVVKVICCLVQLGLS